MKKTITIIAVIALVAVLGIALFACAPSGITSATKKLSKAGYTVLTKTFDAEDFDGGFYAQKGLNVITAAHFTSAKSAKKFYEESSLQDNLTQSGKWVYWGTEEAVKAFTK